MSSLTSSLAIIDPGRLQWPLDATDNRVLPTGCATCCFLARGPPVDSPAKCPMSGSVCRPCYRFRKSDLLHCAIAGELRPLLFALEGERHEQTYRFDIRSGRGRTCWLGSSNTDVCSAPNRRAQSRL